jgi:chaperonin GroES
MSENHIPPDPKMLAMLGQATEIGRRESSIRRRPLYDRILVRLLKPEDRTKGGLFIPPMASDNTPYLKAEVMAVGHGRITTSGSVVPLYVQPGMVVEFFRSPASGEQLLYPAPDGDDREWMLIRESHVANVLEGLDRVTSIVSVDGGNLELPS